MKKNNSSKAFTIKRFILLFFILFSLLAFTYIFTFARYYQSITVSFDSATTTDKTYIKPSKFTNVDDLKNHGFTLKLSKVEYKINPATEEASDDTRTYSGIIEVSKTAENPVSYDSATIKYFLKSPWNYDETYVASSARTILLKDGSSTTFSLDYKEVLPYQYLIWKTNHPKLFIHIQFNGSQTSIIDTPETINYYVAVPLNASLK